MKRYIIALCIIAVLGVIYPGLPTLAQPIRVPHENPDTATGLLDEIGFLLSYSQVIKLATNSQYQDAQDILNELEHVDIPDDVRYITNQYNALWQRLFSTMDSLEALLAEASDLLAHNQIYELRQKLDNANADIQNAYALLKDAQVATNSLSDQLNVFAVSATSRVKQAHTQLVDGIERLNDLLSKLDSLSQSLTEQYVQKTELTPTELSFSIHPSTAYVGDEITAYGKLSSAGKSMAGQQLSIFLDDKRVATVITGPDGSYTTSIKLPFIYIENMTFTAIYQPSGNDAGIYLASRSPPVTIDTVFYRTFLKVSAPDRIYPSQPFSVSGEVTSDNDHITRNIQVLLDNIILVEETVSGPFSFAITPPPKASGNSKLTFDVSPQGPYAGASVQRSINVSLLAVHIDTQMPSVILIPADIEISGRVYSELGPVANAGIRLNLNDTSVTTTTRADGSFQGNIKMCILPEDAPLTTNPFHVGPSAADASFNFSPFGVQEIIITADTTELPGATYDIKRDILTINPLSIALIMVAIAALAWLILRRSRTRIPEEKRLYPAESAELSAATPLPVQIPKLTGIRGQILTAYRNVLTTVEKITGVIMSPDTTLREFLKTTRLPSPTANDRFAELTAMTESALYSDRSPQQDTAARAEGIAANIKEELRSGTP